MAEKTIHRKGMVFTDYGHLEYLDGATVQYTVMSNDSSWVAYFTDEDDAKMFLAMKSKTEVK